MLKFDVKFACQNKTALKIYTNLASIFFTTY